MLRSEKMVLLNTLRLLYKEEIDTNSRLPYEHRKMFYKKSASYRGHIHGDTISLKNLTVPYYKDTKVFVRMKY